MNDTILNISKDLKRLATSIEKLAKEAHLTQAEDTTATAPVEITLEEVRAKLATLMQSGKQVEVKRLLKKHGGNKLSDVPKENYPALLKDAEAV